MSYTAFVRTLRLALPLTALGLAGAVLLWPQARPVQGLPPVPADSHAHDENAMLNPRLLSLMANAEPVQVTATRATQPEGAKGPIHLQNPQAELTLRSGDRAQVVAQSGIILPGQPDNVRLSGHVTYTDSRGYQMTTRHLLVNTAKQLAHSQSPVDGHSPTGTVRAEGLQIADGGNLITFQGRAFSTVNLDTATR